MRLLRNLLVLKFLSEKQIDVPVSASNIVSKKRFDCLHSFLDKKVVDKVL